MNPKAVARCKEEKEIDTHAFMHKTMEGTMVIVNGTVESISLSIEFIDKTGDREPVRRDILDLPLNKAKSLYLVLRSMLNILGELDELDECVL